MAKKGKGFWGAVGSFFGSIPVVKSVKKAGKSLKKKIKKAKSKLKLKNLFKKLKRKLRKKIGKVYTKARKFLKLTKKRLVKWYKRTVKKAALYAKKTVQKAKQYYQKAKTQAKKAAVKSHKQTTKETVVKTKPKTENPFVKTYNSLKEIGKDFMNGLDTRQKKALDSPYDFANYLTLGALDGLVSGAKDRQGKMWNSPSDFANYATFGFTGMVNGAVNPKDPLSKEHLLDSFGVVTSLFGLKGVKGTTSKTPSGGQPKPAPKPAPPAPKPAPNPAPKPNQNPKKQDETKGTIKDGVSNRAIDRYYEKTQNIRSDINREVEKIINSDEYKNLSNTQKKKIDRKVKKMSTANVAVAEVSILGIKKEFQAHSQIHSSDSLGSNVGDFSYSKTDRLLETYVDDEFPRFNDTEAKILEDIASQIKDPNTKGRIDLFTDLDACQSCTNLIMEFRRKYPNIELNVYSENMR